MVPAFGVWLNYIILRGKRALSLDNTPNLRSAHPVHLCNLPKAKTAFGSV